MSPINATENEDGDRTYLWKGEAFPSVTTIINGGVPKYLEPWYAKLVAELAYHDVAELLGATSLRRRGARALKLWERRGREYLAAQRAAGMKLEGVDETPRGVALRYLKGEPIRQRDAHAAVGIEVHDQAEATVLAYAREGARLYAEHIPPDEWPEHLRGHQGAFMGFITDHAPTYIATEATIYSRAHGFAGTLDAIMVLIVDGLTSVVDYKSRAVRRVVALQLAAYSRGEFIGLPDGTEVPLPPIRHDVMGSGKVLRLPTSGQYELTPVRIDDPIFRVFLYAREVNAFAKELSKTVLGEPIAPPGLEAALSDSLLGVER